MVPLHEISVVDDPLKPSHSEESSCADDVEVVSSKGDSRADEETASSSRQSLRGDVTFPIKLHEMLKDVERDDNASIVSWSPDGKGFRVHKQNLFVETILPRYFSQTKYRSFQRQLNHYGFDRIIKGPYEGGYRHPDFVRDDPIRCRSMRRLKRIVIPKRVPLDETPSRHDDSSLHGTGKIAAVSPEPSHQCSPKRHFESRSESFTTFQSPMFRPVPNYHRARIVMGTPVPVHPPGTRVYYHNPPPSQPHVTHVYYVPPPPDFHQHSPYRLEYRPAVVEPTRPMYQTFYAKAPMPIMGPMPPHNQVHLRPAHEVTPRNPELFYMSSPPPTRIPPLGMVPVEEEQVIIEPERPTIPSESYNKAPPRQNRLSFSSVNSNQEKSIDDLLLDFLSDDDQEGSDNENDDEILNSLASGKEVLYRDPQNQFSAHESLCGDFPHDLVYNIKGSLDHTNHHPQLVPMDAIQTVAL